MAEGARSSSPALEASGLAKSFGEVRALDGVDLVVGAGEFVVVLGPSGAGKTTLLRLIAGLERPDAGMIRLFGRNAAELSLAERDVALVFQNFSLYPNRTVRANLEFPLRAPGRRLPRAEIAERVDWAAKLLRIEKLLDRSARALSGGEMQRVAIGRAIIRRPRLFLMDEPLTNLDAKLREELRTELRELARGLGTPVLWVTHDQVEALSMADRIAVLVAGRILQDARPEEAYFQPASPRVAGLLGSPPMNVVGARLESGWWTASDGTRIAEAAPGSPERATIGFRPEDVEWTGVPGPATIEMVEDLGPTRVLVASWAGARIRILLQREASIATWLPGDRSTPRVDPARVVVWSGP
ncbi:MAG: ABC transporter ATP-binding protein [Planctomycetota bacterium]